MKKKGAVNWTIGKLLNMVLLVMLLALVIYGVTTEGLNPLIDNLGQKFDDATFMLKDVASGFGMGSSPYENCYVASVAGMGGGKNFLEELGLDSNSNMVINYGCENICNISGTGLGSYQIKDGVFERWEGEDWMEFSVMLPGQAGPVKFHREMYKMGDEMVGEKVKNIFGEWTSERNHVISEYFEMGDYATKSFDKADDCGDCGSGPQACKKNECEAIGRKLLKSCEYKSYFFWGSCKEKGDAPVYTDLDSRLKSHENELIEKAIDASAVESLEVEGIEYKVGFEFFEGVPIISFSSGDKKYGLRYIGEVEGYSRLEFYDWSSMGQILESYSFSLVVWSGSKWVDIGSGDYYRLPDRYFDIAYKGGIVEQFLRSKCI